MEDKYTDALGQLVKEARAKKQANLLPSLDDKSDLAVQLPEPYPHDDDGFAHSFGVDEIDEIKAFFDKYGYVVIRDVLGENEVQATREEFFSNFDQNDEESITNFLDPHLGENMFSRMGIIGINSNLQSPTQLANRQNKNVYQAFMAVYGGETKLFVDHDRLGAMRPTLQRDGTIKNEWQTINNWLHLDCNPCTGEISIASMLPPLSGEHHDFNKEAPYLVQGLLALSDAREQDGGFLCVPGSHGIAKKWTERNCFDRTKSPQLRPDANDPLQQHKQLIPLRAGSLLIWNAFTMHANHPNKSDRWRLCQYIRMYPVTKTRFRPLNPDPDEYPSEFIDKTITPLGRRLFGIDLWDD